MSENVKKKIVHQELTYRDLTVDLKKRLDRVTACYTLLASLEEAAGSGLSEDETRIMVKMKQEIDELMKDVEIKKEMKRLTDEKKAYTGGKILWVPDRLR